MPIQTVQHIADVSFKDHFFGPEGDKPVNGKIQVNHNTFEVTFADGRVNAKFTSGNFFTNAFRSSTLSRLTQTLQAQYDTWLDEQAQIEAARQEELEKTGGYTDNPKASGVAAAVNSFKQLLDGANPPGVEKFKARLDEIAKLAAVRNDLTRVQNGSDCDAIVREKGFLTHTADNCKRRNEHTIKGYVLNMLDTVIDGFLEVVAKVGNDPTKAVDFARSFDGACVEAKGDNIQEWLSRAEGIVKAARSDESKDLAYSVAAEFAVIADSVREPYLEDARKECEPQVRETCAKKGITDEATIKDRIESKAAMIVADKDDEIKPKIREALEKYGKFALYDTLAGAKRPMTEVHRDETTGKWTVTTLVGEDGQPILKPVSGADIDKIFGTMLDLYLDDAFDMGMVANATRVATDISFATREDLHADAVTSLADDYASGKADKAHLAELVKAAIPFADEIPAERFNELFTQALGDVAGLRKNDPDEMKTGFDNFAINYADNSYLDQTNDLGRLVHLVASRTATLADPEKKLLANIDEKATRCAQMFRNAFPDYKVSVISLKNYIKMTLKSMAAVAYGDKPNSTFKSNATKALGYLANNGVLFTDALNVSLGHRAAGKAEVRLHTIFGLLRRALQQFAGAQEKFYMHKANA